MRVQIKQGEHHAILYDESVWASPRLEQFDPAYWLARDANAVRAAGRGQIVQIDVAGRSAVLRRYRRGGWVARLLQDRYLWTGLERSRPAREFRTTLALFEAGLPVARPLAALVQWDRLTARGALVTEYIGDSRTLAQSLPVMVTDQPVAVSGNRIPWAAVGRTLRRFHDAGLDHADLNAHNILLGADEQVHVIDFDRARWRSPEGDAQQRWRSGNLRRLHRSLLKLCRPARGDDNDDAGGADDGHRPDWLTRGWETLQAAYFSDSGG